MGTLGNRFHFSAAKVAIITEIYKFNPYYFGTMLIYSYLCNSI